MKKQCEACNGKGEGYNDSYDQNGEHVQTEYTCEECGGSGLKDND